MDVATLPSTLDPPFLPAIECTLNLPKPPSVNLTRKVSWAHRAKHQKWVDQADMRVMAQGGMRNLPKMPGAFEAILTLDEHTCNLDLDNAAKAVIDYARRLGLIVNDDKRYMRRITIEWGRGALRVPADPEVSRMNRGVQAHISEYLEQVFLRVSPAEKQELERMRIEGGEFATLSPFIRSLLQHIIRDDQAAEGNAAE